MASEQTNIQIDIDDRASRKLLLTSREVVAHHLKLRYAPGTDVPHYDAARGVVFFYGGPFSNFVGKSMFIRHPQPFALPASGGYGRTYATVEHFFQACKAKRLHEHNVIANAGSPGEAKARGNQCDLREDWDVEDEDGIPTVKYEAMLAGLRVKFSDPELREILLSTGERYIAEDSPTDFIWGIRDEDGGFTGKNLLGLALMQVREEIRTADA
jgi:N-glycosidase YbiA